MYTLQGAGRCADNKHVPAHYIHTLYSYTLKIYTLNIYTIYVYTLHIHTPSLYTLYSLHGIIQALQCQTGFLAPT